jgi:drug/metabolite transporter (DMT)-like permease
MPLDESATIPAHARTARERRHGLAWGLLGVASFSLTLPATRVAVAELDPVFVGLGRAVVAAALAAIVLAATRTPWPGRRALPRLALVAGGVIIGFPLFSALAMRHVPAAHGAVIIGILPLATALAGAWIAHERPSRAFWGCAAFGSAVVVAFAFWQGGGWPQPADALLALAAIAAAIGYAEGGRLARTLGGWQVISWALVIAAPFVLVPTLVVADARLTGVSTAAWAGFAYVGVVSMFLGFFAWYRGLALGGIGAVGQVQLLQPFLTIFASAVLLGETIDPATFIAAALVIAAIAMGRRAG